MLAIRYTSKMKRDTRRMIKRGKDIAKLSAVLFLLANKADMPDNYGDHPLKGDMRGFRECHIEPDWLLVYQIKEEQLVLVAAGTGTHADLFDE